MVKKWTVINNDLKVLGGGIYAITPFDKVDEFGKMVYKIGEAINFSQRTDGYHTYFPLGLYICALLEIPPKIYRGHEVKEETTKKFYKKVEKFIMDYIIRKGGVKIHSTARVKNKNIYDEGETEWVYCTEQNIKEAFAEANEIFGGLNHKYKLPDTKKLADKSEARKPNYIGRIIYHFR